MRVVAPESTLEAAEVMRDAYDRGLHVQVRGQHTKHDWALPPRRVDLIVETRNLHGTVEHAAGDLVAVVRAGTPLRDFQAVLCEQGQQLAIDEPLPGASVGGTVATNTSGPRRLRYGTIRDLLIGITVVRPDGAIAHAGGKVVKNVAGYDLCKLFTGSYGTLGLITECVFRLHPVRKLTFLNGRQPNACAVEINGSEIVSALEGEDESEPPPWWGRYPWEPGQIGVKLTARLSKVETLPFKLRGSIASGVLYAALEDADQVELARRAAHEAGGHAVVLTAPRELHERLDMWGPVPGLGLMRRVKAQFDPKNLMAPGVFVGGI